MSKMCEKLAPTNLITFDGKSEVNHKNSVKISGEDVGRVYNQNVRRNGSMASENRVLPTIRPEE